MSSPSEPRRTVKVFISYAHEDKALRDRLQDHLANLKNQAVIETWFDGEIVAGQEWEPEILMQLNAADVILLLISAAFMASNYIQAKEMTRAMERHAAGEACVIPILLRPVDYHGAPFGKIEALPTDAKKRLKAVTEWSNRDRAYANIAAGIRRAVEQLDAQRRTANP